MSVISFLLASSDGGGSTSGAVVQLLILLAIPVALYFVMIRPQRRRVREQAAMQSELGVGDEVLLTSGIYGFISDFDGDDRVWVEIDDDVQVRVAKAAISGKVDTSGLAPAGDRTASSKLAKKDDELHTKDDELDTGSTAAAAGGSGKDVQGTGGPTKRHKAATSKAASSAATKVSKGSSSVRSKLSKPAKDAPRPETDIDGGETGPDV